MPSTDRTESRFVKLATIAAGAIALWSLDSVIDSFVFGSGDFASNFLAPSAHSAFSRIAFVLLAVTTAALLHASRTRRRETLAQLAGSEARFAAMAAAAADGVVLMDADGNVVYWNDAAARMFGRSAEAVMGHNLHELLCPPEQRSLSHRGVATFAQSGHGGVLNITRELMAVGPGGALLPVEVSVSGFRFGGRWHSVGIIRDNSEKNAAQQAVRQAYERIEQANREWREAFDAVRAPMFLHDADGRVMRANRAYAARAGMEITALIGRPYWELFPKGDGPLPGCSRALYDECDDTHDQIITAAGEVFHSRGFAVREPDGSFRWSIHIFEEITGEFRMRQALEESERRLAEAQRIAHLGHWDWDLAGGSFSWSDELFRIFGLAPGQVTPSYDEFRARVLPDDREVVEGAARAAIERGEPFDTEFRAVRADGGVRVVQAQGEVTCEDGRAVRMFGTLHDITERKRAEARIATLSQIHALLGDANKAIARSTEEAALFDEICRIAASYRGLRMAWIGVFDADGRKVVPVASAGHVDGYLDALVLDIDDPGLLAGLGLQASSGQGHVVHAQVEHDPRMQPWRDAALARGYRAVAVFAFRSDGAAAGIMAIYADQDDFFTEESMRLFEGLANDLSFAVQSLRDRARRRTAETALRQTHMKLALHIERTPLAVVELDGQGRIALWNGAAERIFGYRPEQVTGCEWAVLMPPAGHDRAEALMTTLFAERRSSVLCTENLTADGRLIHCEWYLTPLTDEADGVSGVMALANDITELITSRNEVMALNASLEERVRSRTRELEAVNRELESFAYSVSHDLRAPLRSIDGFSGLLASRYESILDATGRDYFGRVRKAARRMADLIDDLLRLSRVTRAQMELTDVDLSGMAERLMADIREEEPDRALEWHCAPNVVVRADSHLLRIALENLLRNAWKFTARRERARIEFGVQEELGERVFFVRDNGAGFDMRYADKLFGAFQRLHAVDDFTGTGIGLATVQRIVTRHGGQVWAEAKVEEGATFHFTLGV